MTGLRPPLYLLSRAVKKTRLGLKHLLRLYVVGHPESLLHRRVERWTMILKLIKARRYLEDRNHPARPPPLDLGRAAGHGASKGVHQPRCFGALTQGAPDEGSEHYVYTEILGER